MSALETFHRLMLQRQAGEVSPLLDESHRRLLGFAIATIARLSALKSIGVKLDNDQQCILAEAEECVEFARTPGGYIDRSGA